jgi:hypothetical protein
MLIIRDTTQRDARTWCVWCTGTGKADHEEPHIDGPDCQECGGTGHGPMIAQVNMPLAVAKAAPAMLAALREARAIFAVAQSSGDDGVAEIIATIDAAIAQAEGK